MSLEIIISNNNRKVKVIAEVKDSLHASMLADRINSLSYLKVCDRFYNFKEAVISAYTIPGMFSIEKLHNDLENMSDLIILPTNEKN